MQHYGKYTHTAKGRKEFGAKYGPLLRALEVDLGGRVLMFGSGTSSLYRMMALEDWAVSNDLSWHWMYLKPIGGVGCSRLIQTFEHTVAKPCSWLSDAILVFVDDFIEGGSTLKSCKEYLLDFHGLYWGPHLGRYNQPVGGLFDVVVRDEWVKYSYRERGFDFIIGESVMKCGSVPVVIWGSDIPSCPG